MPRDKSFDALRMDETRLPRDAKAVTATQSQALKDGEVLADDGASYATVQAAQDAASSWIRLPPETFNESVTIDTAGLSVVGSGYDTLVDGSTTGPALSIEAGDVTVRSLQAKSDSGGLDSAIASVSPCPSCVIENVWVTEAGFGIIEANDTNWLVNGVRSSGTIGNAVRMFGARSVVVNCDIQSGGIYFDAVADDSLIANNVVYVADVGISYRSDDTVCYGNRVSAGDRGIRIDQGTDCVCVNNRVDATNTEIEDTGTNTLRDSNVTGPAN